MFPHMNIRTFVTILSRKAQCNFPKMRGGSKAVWNFSENSSDLLTLPVPQTNVSCGLSIVSHKFTAFPNKSVLPVFAWLVTPSILRDIPHVSMFKINVDPLKTPGGIPHFIRTNFRTPDPKDETNKRKLNTKTEKTRKQLTGVFFSF